MSCRTSSKFAWKSFKLDETWSAMVGCIEKWSEQFVQERKMNFVVLINYSYSINRNGHEVEEAFSFNYSLVEVVLFDFGSCLFLICGSTKLCNKSNSVNGFMDSD